MKKLLKIVICGMIFLCLGCGNDTKVYLENTTEEVVSTEEDTMQSAAVPQSMCYVHVCGAVKEPGVYALKEGSRIFEAIEAAGGLKKYACAESVNQAEAVADGQMVKVLTYAEMEEQQTTEAAAADGRVNINQAGVEELMTLPGIGESKANSIIAYRNVHGAFSSVEELKNIAGIKEGVYSKIKDSITID
ncbi:MAG: helix-hairpin-helix domain-containing protein [Lachnospiraceae bacterium]|nr:helix-hairpin-helix domain-containing protein [Lachnospiraceae bacterium]